MRREVLLRELKREAAMPGPLPGVPYDSPEDQKARRETLATALRGYDRYIPGSIKPTGQWYRGEAA